MILGGDIISVHITKNLLTVTRSSRNCIHAQKKKKNT